MRRRFELILSCGLIIMLGLVLPQPVSRVKAAPSIITVKANQSINNAIASASDGATVIVKGVHREQLNIERDNITIIGDGATLDGSTISKKQLKDNNSMIYVKGANIKIQGLNISGLKYKGSAYTPVGIQIDEGSEDIVITNCNIHDMGVKYQGKSRGYNAHGILVTGSDKEPVTDISVMGCTLYNLSLGNSEALVLNGNVDGFEISNNNIYNCDNIGIDAIGYEQSKTEHDRARNGSIHDNRVTKISSDPATNPTYDSKCAGGIYVDGGLNIQIYNNYVENCDIGIEISSEHKGKTAKKIDVYNNTLVNNNSYAGICVGGATKSNGYTEDCNIKNNTVVNDKATCLVIQNAGTDNTSNKITNNLLIAEESASAFETSFTSVNGKTGCTIKNNMSNQEISEGDNTVIEVTGIEIDSSAQKVSIGSDTDLSEVGSDITN